MLRTFSGPPELICLHLRQAFCGGCPRFQSFRRCQADWCTRSWIQRLARTLRESIRGFAAAEETRASPESFWSSKTTEFSGAAGEFRCHRQYRSWVTVSTHQPDVSNRITKRTNLALLTRVDRSNRDKTDPEPMAYGQNNTLALKFETIACGHQNRQ
jgi:hypothetical protein